MQNKMIMLPEDIKRLFKAVFKQAVKDYVKIVAAGKDSLADIGSRREIEKYLDTGMASAGTNMYIPDVKQKLIKMTQCDAVSYLKEIKISK